MNVTLRAILAGFALATAPSWLNAAEKPAASKTAAESYSEYVSAVIPLTFDIAHQDANIKESGIFITLASEAQSHIVQATDDAATVGYYIPLVSASACSLNPDGTVDLASSYTQYLIAGELASAAKAIQSHRDAYLKIRTDLAVACDKTFDDYRIENLSLDFVQPDIELADGVYVENGVAFFVTLAKSLWQMLTNYDEQQDIDDQSRRLTEQRARSSDYRMFGASACRQSKEIADKLFTQYDNIVPSLQEFIASVPQEKLEERRAMLRECFALVSKVERTALEQAARSEVRTKLLAQTQREFELKTYLLARQRIDAARTALRDTRCGADAALVNSLRADGALAQSLGLHDDLDLRSGIDTILAARNKQCAVSPDAFQARTQRGRRFFRFLFGSKPPEVSGAISGPISSCVSINGFSFGPLCSYLHDHGPTGPVGPTGAYTGPGGSLCAYSQRPAVGSYTMCGGSAFGQGDITTDPWGAARAIIAATAELPGQYNLKRGALVGSKLEQQLQSIRERVQQLKAVKADIDQSQVQYVDQVFEPAGKYAIEELLRISSAVSTQLVPKLNATSPIPEIPGPDFGDPGFELSSEPIHELRNRIEHSGTTAELMKQLEVVWLVVHYRAGVLSSADREALAKLYEQYFDGVGLLNENALGPILGQVSRRVSEQFGGMADSPESIAVKYQLNRALIGLSSVTDAQLVDYGYDSLGLGIAAQSAFTENDSISGDQLLSIATNAADIALGIFPVASAANNAVQIIFGMATGRDYTGHAMRAADYALRGLGIALTLVPAAEPVMKFGAGTISKYFVRGATLLRRLGLQGELFEGLKKVPAIVGDFTALIGEYFSKVPATDEALREIAPRVEELVAAETRVATGNSVEWVTGTWETSRQTDSALDEGSTILFKNSPAIIGQPPENGLYARVLPKDADLVTKGSGVLNTKEYAFITAASDIEEMDTSGQIAERLSLFEPDSTTQFRDLSDDVVVLFRFKNGYGPGALPVNFTSVGGNYGGWIAGGVTRGGAREWIVDSDLSTKGFIEIVGKRVIKPGGGTHLLWNDRSFDATNSTEDLGFRFVIGLSSFDSRSNLLTQPVLGPPFCHFHSLRDLRDPSVDVGISVHGAL
jgi:hypothetical protein